MDTKKDLVESSLLDLLKSHSMEVTDLTVDEIVLNYINCIIEEFDDSQEMDEVDVEHFVEMMEAYIPGFAHIQSAEVTEWMFQLSRTISADSNSNTQTSSECHSPCHLSVCPVRSPSPPRKPSDKPTSSKVTDTTDSLKNHSSPPDKEEGIFDEKVHRLLEMFPAACQLEAFHCLSLANGDMDEATQLILDRHESGETIVSNNDKKYLHFQSEVQDDKKVRDQMLQKYAYIDEEEDKKIYRPAAPKSVPKKLVRYLDNKVVSTKGERFTLFNKDDEDKSYLNLKSSKKCRLP
ncbi:CUE domain-containing protein 2-B-like [Argonauta hians]